MIKHHPNLAVLNNFVDGDITTSVSIVVASHIEMCDQCKQQVAQLTQQAAARAFELDVQINESFNFEGNIGLSDELSMIDLIASSANHPIHALPKTVTEIDIAGKRLSLPRAMKSIGLKEWQGVGKVSRSRLDFSDEERRMSLLHIGKGGSVPRHTHKGFEITLLLEGSFEDEMGRYEAGDFIWLHGEHTHNPISSDGCLCLTVSSDAIHFTQGVSQILNPLGKYIY